MKPLPGDLAALAAGGQGGARPLPVGARDRARRPGAVALLDAAWRGAARRSPLGLTGPPGVGKSTLTNALDRAIFARGARRWR